ncbi:MAG TPA: hypothetical protein VLF91_02650 [Candidatus Saccharimonadales bacterium]|nr:hypothetical protein [Candidatus Saccharimonadales bacterium]
MNQTERPVRRHRDVIVTLICMIVILAGACGLLLVRYHQTIAKQQATTVQQAASLATQLGKHFALPAGQPTLATVLNRAKLGDAQLVNEAQNGDLLLIFAEAKRVILYRPSTGKVVDMFHVDAPKASAVSTTH